MRHDKNYNWGSGTVVFSVLCIIFVILIVIWHFAEAWRILPGAYYISGQVPVSAYVNGGPSAGSQHINQFIVVKRHTALVSRLVVFYAWPHQALSLKRQEMALVPIQSGKKVGYR